MMLIDVSATVPDQVPPGMDDRTLVDLTIELAGRERRARAAFIVHLAKLDERNLYLQEGCSSLFAWLTEKLKLANASAYRRVTAARLQRRMPAVASYLHEGRLSLTKLCHLRNVLAPDNHLALLEQAASMTEKEVEELALILDPRRLTAPPRDSIRPLPPASLPLPLPPPPPTPATATAQPPAEQPPPTAPIPPTPIRHAIKMTVGPELMTLLEDVRAALSHSHPGATLETLLGHCMKETLKAHRKRSRSETDRPRPRQASRQRDVISRNIPAEVERAVWTRDDARCTFVASDGHRCLSTHFVQVHHDQPYARGGPATIENCRLLCSSHNHLMARFDFGDAFMDRRRARSQKADKRGAPSGQAHFHRWK